MELPSVDSEDVEVEVQSVIVKNPLLVLGITDITWAELSCALSPGPIANICSKRRGSAFCFLKLRRETMLVWRFFELNTTTKVEKFSLRKVVGIAALATSSKSG